jgi:hypothetical protein
LQSLSDQTGGVAFFIIQNADGVYGGPVFLLNRPNGLL